MQTPPSAPPKPVSVIWRPDLTLLPRLHWRRRLFRTSVRALARILIRLLTEARISGMQHFPLMPPPLVVMNHLGDTDTALLLAALPAAPEALGKIELLHEFPVLGKLMDWYGTIWLHRGRPDRRALACALEALEAGRLVVIAPEGRYTLTGALEKGGDGAAWLAINANAAIIPIALTGTENARVYGSLRSFHRPQITLTVGEPFRVTSEAGARSLGGATLQIMQSLARLLPPEYRGVYAGLPPA